MSETQPQPPKLCVFDNDGTLTASLEWGDLVIRPLKENGHTTCVVTGGKESDMLDYNYKMLAEQGVDPAHDTFVFEAKKRKKEYYPLLAAQLGVNIRDMILIDDDPQNILAAEKAGLEALYFVKEWGGVATIRKKLVALGVLPS